MTTLTPLPARRAKKGGTLFCGHQVAGRYDCTGIIGRVSRVRLTNGEWSAPSARPHMGMAEDPPGSRHWRLSARATRQLAQGRGPYGYATRFPNGPGPAPVTPWTMKCPRCNCLAVVTDDVLS